MAERSGADDWKAVADACEAMRANVNRAIAVHAYFVADGKMEPGAAVCAAVGVAMAHIIEAGALIRAVAPNIAETAWELQLLDTLRGAIRGAGKPVDEHGRAGGKLDG